MCATTVTARKKKRIISSKSVFIKYSFVGHYRSTLFKKFLVLKK